MEKPEGIQLGSVQETLLMPLWGRAVETRKAEPLLIDREAVRIVEGINYDFKTIAENINKLTRASWVARSIYFDRKITEFIRLRPDATIANIGCGLDTTFERIDNGRIKWIDLDLPDVIGLRRNFIHETERRRFIAASALDKGWYGEIKNRSDVMFMLAGVLYYFDERDIERLFRDFSDIFPGAEIVFDYCSVRGMKMANKVVIKKGGMDSAANLKWAIDDIFQMEKWSDKIKVIDAMPAFREHKKNYPFYRRLGMNISDALRILSLAHVSICEDSNGRRAVE